MSPGRKPIRVNVKRTKPSNLVGARKKKKKKKKQEFPTGLFVDYKA